MVASEGNPEEPSRLTPNKKGPPLIQKKGKRALWNNLSKGMAFLIHSKKGRRVIAQSQKKKYFLLRWQKEKREDSSLKRKSLQLR